MTDTLEFMQRRARELARSGKHVGWRSVAFELQFEPDLKQVFWFYSSSGDHALQWLHSPATKAEIDDLCFEARHPSNSHNPKAARKPIGIGDLVPGVDAECPRLGWE